MREPPPGAAWVSTALGGIVAGPVRSGEVLASTRFALYLSLDGGLEENADPSVVAVVGPGAVRLPIAASVLSLPTPAVGAPAQVGHGVIAVGPHSWRPVRWWDPTPRLDPDALRANGWRLSAVVGSEPAAAYGIDVERARVAVTALGTGDATPALGLLGAGPGLTPAGDDVVAGALAALALMDRLPVAAAAAITSAARSRTTSLSAALLAAAARGQVVPEAARVLRALARGDDFDTVAPAAQRLFAVGATSGHDLALGLSAALTSLAPVTVLEPS